jgi:hypothetical protein
METNLKEIDDVATTLRDLIDSLPEQEEEEAAES